MKRTKLAECADNSLKSTFDRRRDTSHTASIVLSLNSLTLSADQTLRITKVITDVVLAEIVGIHARFSSVLRDHVNLEPLNNRSNGSFNGKLGFVRSKIAWTKPSRREIQGADVKRDIVRLFIHYNPKFRFKCQTIPLDLFVSCEIRTYSAHD